MAKKEWFYVTAGYRLRARFWFLAILFASALVGVVLLAKRAEGMYDASGACLIGTQYTKVTSGSSVSYRVSYTFVAHGQQYTGTDTIYRQPRIREATVYYMAGDPRDNGLSPNRLNNATLALSGLAFLIAIVAYWRLPTDYFTTPAGALTANRLGVGDSGGEHLRMDRGKYDRAERLEHYHTGRELVLMLVDLVSRGGNLLLDIGPDADGTIPVVMEERLI